MLGRKRVMLDQVGNFADGVAVKMVGEETFRVCKELIDGVVLVNRDAICASIKDMFEEKRSILEPAGAVALAGAEAYCNYYGLKDENVVAITSGANMNFDRLRLISELVDVGRKRKAMLATFLPEKLGSFKEFCEQNRLSDVWNFYSGALLFKIMYSVLICRVALQTKSELEAMIERMGSIKLHSINLTDNDLVQDHFRHLDLHLLDENSLVFLTIFDEKIEKSNGVAFLKGVNGAFNEVIERSFRKKRLDKLHSHCFQGELNLKVPLERAHKQVIWYEAASLLRIVCGRLGHTTHCPYKTVNDNPNEKNIDEAPISTVTRNGQHKNEEMIKVTGLNLSPPTGPGKSSLPSDLKIPYNDPYAPKFPTNDSNTIPLNDELSKVGSTKLNSSIPNLSHLKDLKIHESPLFLTNTMAPPDSQLKADRPQMDFMHENKNSLHINSAVNNSDVHPYNDYTARDDSDMLNSQNSPSPIHFTKSHVSEHTPFPAINHGSFSNLPIQGSAYPSQPTLPSSSTIPEIYSDGTREQSFPLLNLHINESYSSLYTPIMAGGGTHGTCTNLHHGSEWSGMSCTDSKLSGPSANHNGGNGERN
ncbi:Threonine dehydratase biosynthetic, chloroplastic [Capsicum annuum]|uniref:threonine ammonia-lyase n=1 Tax=Capsicum annuum TaxID=4072 RepID=A0A2G2YLL5_CAPAN|nr:Threonine dehydratase biosynthetic, chloroplastic [Capsicum annuum]